MAGQQTLYLQTFCWGKSFHRLFFLKFCRTMRKSRTIERSMRTTFQCTTSSAQASTSRTASGKSITYWFLVRISMVSFTDSFRPGKLAYFLIPIINTLKIHHVRKLDRKSLTLARYCSFTSRCQLTDVYDIMH